MSIQCLLSFCLLFPLALASLEPLSPGPGDVFNSRSPCAISWDIDSTKTWKNVTIYLMSGSNLNMSIVTPVIQHLDGTDPKLTPFHWQCPDVTPNAAIYFYQFTNNDDLAASTWTTRFTIASPSGATIAPENSKQPGGDPIPWGVGHILLPTSVIPAKPSLSPRSLPSVGFSCEAFQCTAPLADASSSDSGNDTHTPLWRYTRSSEIDFARKTRGVSRASRGGPALEVQFICGLTMLLLAL